MASKSVKPPKKTTRDQIIQVRTTVDVKSTFNEAAERAGLTLSAWIVTTCLRVARAEREKADKAARAAD